jgi:hypothetical protein
LNGKSSSPTGYGYSCFEYESRGKQQDFCTSEVQKYKEVQRSTEKYREVRKKYLFSFSFFPANRTKVFCYWEMSKILFPVTEHFCSVFETKTFDIFPQKYREVRRSTEKYAEVQRSTKYKEVHRSTEKYREVHEVQKSAVFPLN